MGNLISISCDAIGCDVVAGAELGETIHDTSIRLYRLGWRVHVVSSGSRRRVTARDYCPDHAATAKR